MATIHEHAQEITQTLGSRLRALRESRDWTLENVAELTGLSKAFLSRLECGERQPSLGALGSIAKALNVSIATLFEQPDQAADCVIVRGGSNAAQFVNGLTYQPLSGSTKPFNLNPIAVTVPADRAGVESYQHDGEEWLTVTSGRLRLSVEGRQYVLEAGDSAHFDSRLAHRLDALDGVDAHLILVACPIPLALNPRRKQAESEAARFVG